MALAAGFHPDASAATFDDFLADRESDAGSRVFLCVVEAFEESEYFPLVLGVDAYAVISDSKGEVIPGAFETDVDLRFHPVAAIFYSVSNQVLEHLLKLYGRYACLLYTSPSPRDRQKSRMP